MGLFVFVLMPFKKSLNKRYEAIKRAAEEAGMRAERVDKQFFLREGITDRIIRQIESADVLVADLSSGNPNVMYEVGWAHSKNQLCIPLTNEPKKIPFDVKNRRHVVFDGSKDLKKKLAEELEALKAEAELSYDYPGDPECFVKSVTVIRSQNIVTEQSTAASIRVRVRISSELHQRNVSAHITKIERRIGNGRWKQFDLIDPIPLTWADNAKARIDFIDAAERHVNVFHVDHNDNKLTVWGFDILQALQKFLDAKASYRVTVAVLDRKIRLDIGWNRHWQTMTVKHTGD